MSPTVADGRRALLVDDDDNVRRVTRGMLEWCDLTVVAAPSGTTALGCIHRNGPFHLVVFEVKGPTIGGGELALAVWGEYPMLPVLFVSEGGLVDVSELPGRVFALRKPLMNEQLEAALMELLDS